MNLPTVKNSVLGRVNGRVVKQYPVALGDEVMTVVVIKCGVCPRTFEIAAEYHQIYVSLHWKPGQCPSRRNTCCPGSYGGIDGW